METITLQIILYAVDVKHNIEVQETLRHISKVTNSLFTKLAYKFV
jgi:hypothetical protein